MQRSLSFAALCVAIVGTGACGRGTLSLGDELGDGGASGVGSGSGASGSESSGNGPGNGSGSSGSGASGSGSSGSGSSGSGASGSGSSGSGSSGSGSSGSGSSGSGSTGSGQMVCPGFGDACTSCASQNCADTWCGCVNNPDCLALFTCFGNCNGNGTCEDQCMVDHADGISDVILVSGCAGTTCSASCEWGNPEFGPCQECIFNDCSSEMNACLAVPACGDLWTCFGTCGELDLTCQSQCYDAYPGGIALLQTALQCVANACSNECQ